MLVDTKLYESKIQRTDPYPEYCLLIYTLQQFHHGFDLSDIPQSPEIKQ